jgi:Sec7-like guanine-nucleotide exchange factor
MEKFGEKLSKDRPEDFGNAEGVYLLAYATLMLQTSVHNPEAKKLKMSLDDFKKITKGVKLNDREDMDYDALKASIYDNILREPFTLDEDEDARMKLEASTNTNKKLLFDKEREGILKRGHNMLR